MSSAELVDWAQEASDMARDLSAIKRVLWILAALGVANLIVMLFILNSLAHG